jgi:hypothetical protein
VQVVLREVEAVAATVVDEVIAGIFRRDSAVLATAVNQPVISARGTAGLTPLNAAVCILWPLGVMALLAAGADATDALGFLKAAVCDLDGPYVDICRGIEAAVEILNALYQHGVPLELQPGRAAPAWQLALAVDIASKRGYRDLAIALRRMNLDRELRVMK